MMAQKIAMDRGQIFDIEAFLTPTMRDQWLAISNGRPWPSPSPDHEEGTREDEQGVKEEVKVDMGEVRPMASDTDMSIDKPLPLQEAVPPTIDGESSTTHLDGASIEPKEIPTSLPTQANTDTDVASLPPSTPIKQAFKLHANSPAFLNMHWKQRQKRLHQLAIRESALERGEKPEYFPELEALIRGEEEKEKEKEREEEVGQKRKRGLTEGDIEGIRASASHW